MMIDIMTAGPERLAASLRQLVTGAEDLLDALRKEGDDQYREAAQRMRRDIERARERLDEAQDTIVARTRAIAKRTDRLAHAHPWETAGATAMVALLVGVAVGLLAGRAYTQRVD
ncbi:MAG: hypothetical protein OEW34_00785 [Burkholderiaceae bacterium]|jgi:ElaB/YqjD/DUF883 family membrane-anchored ribosome-binding protein|nr:hypothetical protein [Burkholderiaceae bacterium]